VISSIVLCSSSAKDVEGNIRLAIAKASGAIAKRCIGAPRKTDVDFLLLEIVIMSPIDLISHRKSTLPKLTYNDKTFTMGKVSVKTTEYRIHGA
jgi:hypothetical protein